MAVTRRCHIVRAESMPSYAARDALQDHGVNDVLAKMAPAERIVSTTSFESGGYKFIYIFTESFGLGPVQKGP